METVKLIVLCVFAGLGITAALSPTIRKFLADFYDMGKKNN